MAKRKRMIDIDFSCFGAYAEKLDKLGADLKKVFTDGMEQAAETVEWDVVEAMETAHLPAQGEYSTGKTKESIIRDAKASWSGSVGTIGLGFDKTKPGAGGFLITGTPKMRPNMELQAIFGRKKYETQIRKDIEQLLQDEIDTIMKGR